VVAQAARPIEADIADNLPPLQGDRRRLADTLGHLVDNAVKFSPSEGTVKSKLWAEAGAVRHRGFGTAADAVHCAGAWR